MSANINLATMKVPPIGAPILQSLVPAGFVVVWSTGYLAGKIAVAHGGAFTVLVWRFGFAALVFALLAISARVAWPSWRQLGHSAVVGMLSLTLQFGGVYAALQWGASAGVAALLIGSMPLGTSLLATLLGERLTTRQWTGFGLGFVGVLLVIADRVGPAALPVGALIALLIGLFGICAGTVYQKRHGSSIDLRIGLAVQHAVATLALLPFAFLLEQFHNDGSAAFVLSTGWLVLVNSVGGFALLFVLLRRGAATDVAALFYLVPPVTAAMSFALLGEHLGWLKLLGFVFAAAGVYLGTRQRRA
jgi:drug/metabolite transporter (DMT)-like permease